MDRKHLKMLIMVSGVSLLLLTGCFLDSLADGFRKAGNLQKLLDHPEALILFGEAAKTAPMLKGLVLTAADTNSITLKKPAFIDPGFPAPKVLAYIGVNKEITSYGPTVEHYIQGPVDVRSEGHRFTGLDSTTIYKIIVVARNSADYSRQEIIQSTAGIAPVLSGLAIEGTGYNSITLDQPVFATAGLPLPAVQAYIGVSGSISMSVSGTTVYNAMQGPVDVSSDGCTFSGLSAGETYDIYVVARNTIGYSIRHIIQSIATVAPELNDLSIESVTDGSITLARPTFSKSGNPVPDIRAFIGKSGTIMVSGSTVSGYVQGNVNVAGGGYQFINLDADTEYEVVVVSKNSAGYSVKQATRMTPDRAPVLSALSLSSCDAGSLTLAKPAFSKAGVPSASVTAYFGPYGSMTINGADVSGYARGPADVSSGGCIFDSLSAGTRYTIIVVAQNGAGYSMRQLSRTTRTGGILYIISLNMPYAVTCLDPATGDYINGESANSTFYSGSFPSSVAVDPSANRLYVVNESDNYNCSVTYFNAMTGSYLNGAYALSVFPAGGNSWAAAVNPSAHILYIVNSLYYGQVQFFNATTGAYLNGTYANSYFLADKYPRGAAVDPDSNILYVTNSGSNTITFFNATTGAYANGTLAGSSFATGNSPGGVAVNHASGLLYVVNWGSNTVTFFNAGTGAYANGTLADSSFPTGTHPDHVAVNPPANVLYVTNEASNTVTFYNATTGAYLNGTVENSSFQTGSSPQGMAVSSALNILYVTNSGSNTVTFFNATTGACINGTLGNSSFQVPGTPIDAAVWY